MFNFFKAGIEFNNLAKSFNGMNVIIQWLNPRIENSADKSEFTKTIFYLSYIARKGVWDRIEKYGWEMHREAIIVTTISKNRITLNYALSQTIGKVSLLASELGIVSEVQEIMDGGALYFEIEKHIPDNIKKLV